MMILSFDVDSLVRSLAISDRVKGMELKNGKDAINVALV
jgi:hypothetical protein